MYQIWCNGNEQFYYRGDNADLNDALAKFATCKVAKLQVILQAGPAETKSFDGKHIAYDWEIHYLGGIAAAVTAEEQKVGKSELPLTMTIVTTEGCLDENQIVIPESLKGAVSRGDISSSALTPTADDTDENSHNWGGQALAPEPRIDCSFPFEATKDGKGYALPDTLLYIASVCLDIRQTSPTSAKFDLTGEMTLPKGTPAEAYPGDLTIRVTFYDERGRVLLQRQLCDSPSQQQQEAEKVVKNGVHGAYALHFAFDLDARDMKAKTFRVEAMELPTIGESAVETMVHKIGSKALVKAAVATDTPWHRATASPDGIPKESGEIPKEYWTDGVKQLNPQHVYTQAGNLKIVLEQDYAGISGIYVCMPDSSDLPANGYEGYEFIWIEGDVYSFRRTEAGQHAPG